MAELWYSTGMKKTTEQFVSEAKYKHGDRYDYTSSKYCGANKLVKILCRTHGEFSTKASKHLSGSGCQKCAVAERTGTLDRFISKANEVHQWKYDYSKVVYTIARTKVKIICPKHGEFLQVAGLHLAGSGCPKCVGKTRDVLEFLKLSKDVHGDKYDYSKVVYRKSTESVTITCPTHGDFSQPPFRHLRGYGCLKCAVLSRARGLSSNSEEFVSRCKDIHGDTYDYSKVEYLNNSTKIEIVCRKHGSFSQTPASHLCGNGCPACANYGYNKSKPGVFYIYKSDSFIGFGITNNLKSRTKTHKINFKKSGVVAELHKTYTGSGEAILSMERAVKRKFKQQIINTGIEGFKWEAIKCEVFVDLLDFVEEYLK